MSLVLAAIHPRKQFGFAVAGALGVLLVSGCSLYLLRYERPVLYYYGASPEVAQGTAFAILNPFRRRKDEANAEWLIRDLRTEKCQQIARERLSSDPSRICQVMRNSQKASLIWLDPERQNGAWATTRDLWYDLPERKARLVVHFAHDEVGWGVNSVEILR